MKLTKHKFTIISLVLVMLVALTAFFSMHFVNANASGTVTVSGTNVFTSASGAAVSSHTKGEGSDAEYYTKFTISDNEQNVSYRRNLAYSWFEGVKETVDDKEVTLPRPGSFNMKIGFASTSFEKFVITFESQVYNKIKENKSVNYLIFFPAEDGKVYPYTTTDKEATVDSIKENEKISLDADEIEIAFAGRNSADYSLTVRNSGEENYDNFYEGKLENVGGNYAKASTSSTNPLYPLIFGAEFGENKAEADKAEMVLYSLNGQAFKLSSATSYTVNDNQPPVLCLESQKNYFTPGSGLNIDYVAIDVLRSSPSSTVNYYLLNFKDKTEEAEPEYEEADDDFLLESNEDIYLPVAEDFPDGSAFNAYNKEGNLTADMLVSVYVTLTDISSNSETCDVYLDWYVENKYVVEINGKNYMAVASDKQGVRYNNMTPEWQDIKAKYQERVNEAAEDLSAGSSSYMYFPSAESLFAANENAYTDLKFNIYYYHDSQSSNTNLKYNELSLNVTRQGSYTFTIYATDAAGNNMYYLDDNGEVVEIDPDDIWDMFGDENEYDRLPWFTFNVDYAGVSFEETPGMQSTAYVGTAYGGASFKINGVTDSYDTLYRLFHFDSARYYEDHKVSYSYEQFIEVMDDLFEGADTRKYFSEIRAVDDMEETDEDYEKFKDYEWSKTHTSFTPQLAGLYYIRAEVTDKLYNSEPVTCSLAVVASETAKTLKGESDWLKNNLASVILLGIAALAFIGLILVIVIRPKDKGDIDAQFENEKKKDKKKKN